MTHEEQKLFDILHPCGKPTNIYISDSVLTFHLINPIGGANLVSVMNIQKTVINEFPEYKFIAKMVNDDDFFWAVLVKKDGEQLKKD